MPEEVAATLSPPDPATSAAPVSDSTPAPEQAPVETPPTPTPEHGDEADDLGYAEWKKGLGETEAKPGEVPAPAAETPTPEAETPPTEGEPPAPAELSDADKQVLRRHKLEPQAILAIKNLPPSELRTFIDGLSERASFTDRLQHENRELKTKLAELPQQDADEAIPDFDKALESLDPFDEKEFRGNLKKVITSHSASYRQALQQEVQGVLDGYKQALGNFWGRIQDDDFERAMDAWTPPEGVDKSNADVRSGMRKLADELRSGKTLETTYRQTIPLAATHKFQKQLTEADNKRKEKARLQSLRGSAEPTTRQPTVKPALSDEDLEIQGAEAFAKGDPKRIEEYMSQAAGV